MKKAFTLIEVNLAMLIMAGGILSIVGLYAFGFRENAQSREDVAGAALADAVMSPLVAALSQTNLTWDAFNAVQTTPTEGWRAFLDGDYHVVADLSSRATEAINALPSGGDSATLKGLAREALSSSSLKGALVVRHEEGSGVISLAFRATEKAAQLMAQPVYYTEVRFQGVQ